LKRAAELQHSEAQRTLAYLIKEYKHSPAGFGSNGPEAVKALLESSSRTAGDACFELASAYAEGYFGAADYAKAREYFERGASFGNRMCWTELSRYYRQGIGGPRRDTEAYYWISLEARCVDPRSMGGQATWAAREEIAKTLSIDELQKEWTRIDDYIAKVEAKKLTVDFPPFGSGTIDPKVEAEGRKLSMERENEHRTKWRQKKVS
jgi:TPR repeat protein